MLIHVGKIFIDVFQIPMTMPLSIVGNFEKS